MSLESYDYSDKPTIGILVLGPAAYPALATLKASTLVCGMPFNLCVMPSKAFPANDFGFALGLTYADANQLQGWSESQNVLLVFLDTADRAAQQAHQSLLAHAAEPEQMVLTLPFNQNGNWLSEPMLQIKAEAKDVQSCYWYAPAHHSMTTWPSTTDSSPDHQILPLMLFCLLGPLFHPGLVAVEFFELLHLFWGCGITHSFCAVDSQLNPNGIAINNRAELISQQLLTAWEQCKSQYPDRPVHSVFINLLHGQNFDLTELDQVAATFLTTFPEQIDCKVTETCHPALGDGMAIGLLVSRKG